MKEIKLTRGQVALVDDNDFEFLSLHKWYAMKGGSTFYAKRAIKIDGKQKNVLMHWEIMGRKSIDHLDGNGLNNTRSNLRLCTQSENMMNTRKRKNTSSIYKGVHFHSRAKKWCSQIAINGKHMHIGLFNTEIDAAKAYNVKAIEFFCEFANLNNTN